MKSKFGFIPIVLPVLVMVLIIGLINLGNAPWVQAHQDGANDPKHTHNIPGDHPLLDTLVIAQVGDNGAALDNQFDDAFTWAPTFDSEGARRVSRYKVSAVYDVEAILVTATAESDPNEGTVAVRITRNGKLLDDGDGTNGSQQGEDAATTTIELGVTRIEVTVTNPDNTASTETTYVVELTREKPQFKDLTLHLPNPGGTLSNQPSDENSAGSLLSVETNDNDDTDPDILKGSNTLKGNDASLRYSDRAADVRVKYHIDAIGLELTFPTGMRRGSSIPALWEEEVKFNTHGLNYDTTTEPTYEVRNHPLRVGRNEILFTVRSTSTISHGTSYRIVIDRADPQLKTVHYTLGDNPSPVTPTVTNFGLDDHETSTSVHYMETTTNVTAGGTGSVGTVEFKYARKSGEGKNDFDDPDTESYDGMRLARGSNTLYITAYDKETAANDETKYTLEIVREDTPLGWVDLTASSTAENGLHSATSTLYWDETNQTTTTEGFDPGTTTYWLSVDYDVEDIQVKAESPSLDSDDNAAGIPSAGVEYTLTIKSRGITTTTSVTTATTDNLKATLTKIIPLRLGANKITVKAEVDDGDGDDDTTALNNATTYTLNVTRKSPVLRPSQLGVVEYKDNKGRHDFANVTLSPEYKQDADTKRYEVNVRSHIASVGIAANHDSPLSRIFVGGAKIEKTNPLDTPSVDYNERQLTGDSTTIPVDVVLDGHSDTINIVVLRNPTGDLAFNGERFPADSPIKLMDGRALANPIILPESSSKDGPVTYHVQVTDDRGEIVPLSDLGLELAQATREITGTPTLGIAQGYESEFNVEYWASDPIGKETAHLEFVILITHDNVPQIPPRPSTTITKNLLKSLKVDGEAVADFAKTNGGPYTAEVSSDAASAIIEAVPEYANATVTLGNVQFGDDNTLTTNRFGVQLTITVSHPDESADMDYLLTITKRDAPPVGSLGFMNDVGTKTYQSGKPIEALVLPVAKGGTLSYTSYELVDHDDDATPAGLEFNAKTRTLEGTPVLYDDAYKTTYKLMYTVTDTDGESYTDDFRMVICDPDSTLSGDCRNSSSDVSLSSLALSDVTLMPEFASDTMAYTAEVPYETTMTTVTAASDDIDPVTVGVTSDMDADMADGHVDLATGANVITVTATKEYGSEFSETYTVTVTRDDKSNDATLSALSLSAGTLTPAFASETTAYTASVGYNTASVTVTAMASDANATVSGGGSQTLSVGENPISVTVLAEDGVTSMIYTITVTRELPTITATIMAFRDGSTARVTWTPSPGATLQAAAMVAVKPGVTTPTSVDDVEIDTLTYLNASGGNATTDWQIPGSTSMLNISGLDTGKRYLFAVVGWDGSAWSAWQTVVE